MERGEVRGKKGRGEKGEGAVGGGEGDGKGGSCVTVAVACFVSEH